MKTYRVGLLAVLLAIVAVVPIYTRGAPSTGTITGAIGFPSHYVPPMRLYAINADDEAAPALVIHTVLNQTRYIMTNVPAGRYYIVAYDAELPAGGPTLAGAYTAAVRCGLSVECDDHALLPVTVRAGGTVRNADASDWYGPDSAYPLEPAHSVPLPAAALPGAIKGVLIYPSDGPMPPLRIYAINADDEAAPAYYTQTRPGQTEYEMTGLPPATYYVLVRDLHTPGLVAGYSQAVLCGLTVDCTEHSLIRVTVPGGGTVSYVEPHDWYAPPGAFPQEPRGSLPIARFQVRVPVMQR